MSNSDACPLGIALNRQGRVRSIHWRYIQPCWTSYPQGNNGCVARLALFDLDNTLLDREAAFALWARNFIATNGLSPDAWSIIESMDDDGVTPRSVFFSEIRVKLGIATNSADLLDSYRVDYPACYSVDDETVRAIRNCGRTTGRLAS